MDNIIRTHIFTIPELVISSVDRVFEACRKEVSVSVFSGIRRIVLTGCGYSFASCLSLKTYMETVTQLPVLAAPAIEASRFTVISASDIPHTLIIGISSSGQVSRITEALAFYHAHGAVCIALTANPQSAMCKYADAVLDISVPPIGTSNPLRGYAMCSLVLIALCHRIAGMDSAYEKETGKALMRDMNSLRASLGIMDETMSAVAELHAQYIGSEFVGAGYERASAFLGKIEMLGQAGKMAIDEDPEQWLHCNFFLDHPEAIGTMLFMAHNSPAYSRCSEALGYMIHLKRPVVLVSDRMRHDLPGTVTQVILPEITSLNCGLLEAVPPSLLVGHYCSQNNIPYSRGFANQWELFRDGCGTCRSEIKIL